MRGEAQDPAPGRALPGEQVEPRVAAEDHRGDLVLEAGDLLPRLAIEEEVLELPAVAVGHLGEHVFPVVARHEDDLGDAGQLFPEGVDVLVDRRPQLVEIDLLVERHVLGRALGPAGIARVEEACPVLVPGHAPARGAAVDVGYRVGQLLAGGRVVDVEIPHLAPVLGDGDGDLLAVERGSVEVHRRLARPVEGVEIEEDPGRGRIVDRRERDQDRLLLGRLEPEGELRAPAADEVEMRRRLALEQAPDPLPQRRRGGQRVEHAAREPGLILHPGQGLRSVRLLQPLVVVRHLGAVILVHHRTLGRGRIAEAGRRRGHRLGGVGSRRRGGRRRRLRRRRLAAGSEDSEGKSDERGAPRGRHRAT